MGPFHLIWTVVLTCLVKNDALEYGLYTWVCFKYDSWSFSVGSSSGLSNESSCVVFRVLFENSIHICIGHRVHGKV